VFGDEVGQRVKSVKTSWENTRRRANVQGLHFHDLRREFASRLLESPGVALRDVASWVGHRAVTSTFHRHTHRTSPFLLFFQR